MGVAICLAPRGACGVGPFRSRWTCRVFGRAPIFASSSVVRRRMTRMAPAGYPALQYLQSGRVSEVKDPQLAADIRAVVEPHTQADPELKSSRRYTNLSAKDVLEALKGQKGYTDARLPKERTMRDILNRMGYRIKRIQKAKPLKRTEDTDAIFANVKAARREYGDDPESLEISIDTKAKVNEGDYSRGGKKPDRLRGEDAQGVGP